MSELGFRVALYITGFVLGFVLMGFEMLGSRYLNPFFGSGIYTWAALISVTLFSLMVGYFIGGRMVDRYPHAGLLGILVLIAAASMAAIPPLKDTLLIGVIETVGDGPIGVTVASLVVLFIPLTLISCYSPFAVRLLLEATDKSGRQTGAVYGISTWGNILGTLATTFWFIPAAGSTAITYCFAAVTVLCGLFLIWLGPKRA